jgi:photoactive yellow protein
VRLSQAAITTNHLSTGALVTGAFDAFDLQKIQQLHGEELDSAPFGVIVVDHTGTILEYNAYERSMTGIGARTVIGRNFFSDVAPCTAIHEFQGRFGEFLTSDDTSIEPFEFVFPLARGPQRVSVVFVRLANEQDRATICVIRTEVADPSLST